MIWTNAVGAAFTAAVLSVSDGGATFVFPGTGQTNLLTWTQLSAATAARIQAAHAFVPVPPAAAATWTRARSELQRADDLLADGRLTREEHARRCAAVRRAFTRVCTTKGLSPEIIQRLLSRLEEKKPQP